jgi:hypothetical protein
MAKSRYTKIQIAQMDRDANYWKAICEPLGWKLGGFTYQNHAMLHTGRMESLSLNSDQRDAIAKALKIDIPKQSDRERVNY